MFVTRTLSQVLTFMAKRAAKLLGYVDEYGGALAEEQAATQKAVRGGTVIEPGVDGGGRWRKVAEGGGRWRKVATTPRSWVRRRRRRHEASGTSRRTHAASGRPLSIW